MSGDSLFSDRWYLSLTGLVLSSQLLGHLTASLPPRPWLASGLLAALLLSCYHLVRSVMLLRLAWHRQAARQEAALREQIAEEHHLWRQAEDEVFRLSVELQKTRSEGAADLARLEGRL